MTRRSITQNTAFLLLASIVQKIISFGYFVLVARSYDLAAIGQFTTALAFSSMFVILVDLGLTNVLVREGARDERRLGTFASTVLITKCLTWLLAFGGLMLIASFGGYSPDMQLLIGLAGVIMLFDSLHTTLYGVLRVKGNLQYESIGIIGSQAATLVSGGVMMYLGLPIWWLMLAYIIPAALNALYAYTRVRTSKIRLAVPNTMKQAKTLLRLALPFALAGIFTRLYSFMDQIAIQRLLSDEAAGLYAIPIKIATAFAFIPFSLIAVLYPRFSASFVKEKELVAQQLWQASMYLLAISAPIVIGIAMLADPIIRLVYGETFVEATPVLQLVMVSMLFSFQAPLFGAVLNAIKKQHIQTTIVGIVMAITLGLQFVLIPRYGIVGGALAVVASQVLLSTLGYLALPRVLKQLPAGMRVKMIKIIVVTTAMAGAVYASQLQADNVFVSIGVGALAYIGGIFLTNTWNAQEVKEIIQLIAKR